MKQDARSEISIFLLCGNLFCNFYSSIGKRKTLKMRKKNLFVLLTAVKRQENQRSVTLSSKHVVVYK